MPVGSGADEVALEFGVEVASVDDGGVDDNTVETGGAELWVDVGVGVTGMEEDAGVGSRQLAFDPHSLPWGQTLQSVPSVQRVVGLSQQTESLR